MIPYSGLGSEFLKGHPGAQGKELDFPQTPTSPQNPRVKASPWEGGRCLRLAVLGGEEREDSPELKPLQHFVFNLHVKF